MILRIRAVVCLLHCVYLFLSVIGEFVVRLVNEITVIM